MSLPEIGTLAFIVTHCLHVWNGLIRSHVMEQRNVSEHAAADASSLKTA